VLAALARAGLEGIRAKLATPRIVNADPTTLSESERAAMRLVRLPTSLAAALDALEADGTVLSWFPRPLLETYVGMKRAEIGLLDGLDDAAVCRRYGAVY
jgi:glutamine synthetase